MARLLTLSIALMWADIREAASWGCEMHGRGYAHMECNYGKHFPAGWVWAQAVSPLRDVKLVRPPPSPHPIHASLDLMSMLCLLGFGVVTDHGGGQVPDRACNTHHLGHRVRGQSQILPHTAALVSFSS